MFKFSSDSDQVKALAETLIKKRGDKHVDTILKKDDMMSEIVERDLEAKLKKWRLKERKHDFQERINQLTIKELLPKQHVQSKLKQLELYDSVLQEKEGDKEVEEKMGIKLANKYNTISHYDDPLPGETPVKEKNYFEKKKEREEHEEKNMENVDELL